MAITLASGTSQLRFEAGTSNTTDVSTTIEVPSDCDLVVVGVASYKGTASNFSGGGMTFTKGATQVAMRQGAGAHADASTSQFQGTVFYLENPDTGTNKTLGRSFVAASDEAQLISVLFLKGFTSGSVRDSDAVQAATPAYTLPSLTAASDDLVVAWVSAFCSTGADSGVATASNLTSLGNIVRYNSGAGNGDAEWLTHSPSGNVVCEVTTSTSSIWTDGGVEALVFTPGGTAPIITVQPADQTRDGTGTVTFTTTVTGATSYQWETQSVEQCRRFGYL
jgi:hypothetical protein